MWLSQLLLYVLICTVICVLFRLTLLFGNRDAAIRQPESGISRRLNSFGNHKNTIHKKVTKTFPKPLKTPETFQSLVLKSAGTPYLGWKVKFRDVHRQVLVNFRARNTLIMLDINEVSKMSKSQHKVLIFLEIRICIWAEKSWERAGCML